MRLKRRKGDPADPMTVVTRFLDAANHHDIDALRACIHHDFESIQPVHPGRNFRGSGQLISNWKAIFEAEPGFRLTVLRSVSVDDTVWVEVHGAGDSSEAAGIFIVGVQDGRIRWIRVYSDLVEPAPEAPPATEPAAVATAQSVDGEAGDDASAVAVASEGDGAEDRGLRLVEAADGEVDADEPADPAAASTALRLVPEEQPGEAALDDAGGEVADAVLPAAEGAEAGRPQPFPGAESTTGDIVGDTEPTGDIVGDTEPTGDIVGDTEPTGDIVGDTEPTGDIVGDTGPTGDIVGDTGPTMAVDATEGAEQAGDDADVKAAEVDALDVEAAEAEADVEAADLEPAEAEAAEAEAAEAEAAEAEAAEADATEDAREDADMRVADVNRADVDAPDAQAGEVDVEAEYPEATGANATAESPAAESAEAVAPEAAAGAADVDGGEVGAKEGDTKEVETPEVDAGAEEIETAEPDADRAQAGEVELAEIEAAEVGDGEDADTAEAGADAGTAPVELIEPPDEAAEDPEADGADRSIAITSPRPMLVEPQSPPLPPSPQEMAPADDDGPAWRRAWRRKR